MLMIPQLMGKLSARTVYYLWLTLTVNNRSLTHAGASCATKLLVPIQIFPGVTGPMGLVPVSFMLTG